MEPIYLLSENSDHLFFAFDIEKAVFTYFNPAFDAFFDLNGTDADPKVLLNMVHHEDKAYILDKLSAITQTPKNNENFECRFVRGKNERALRINAGFKDGVISGTAEDITLYRDHTDNLQKHGNKKNSILNILAHDLAGPIGTIGNLCELIKRDHSKERIATEVDHIDKIKAISEHCIQLIRGFLNQEFLESAGVNLLKKRVNLAEKISILLKEYQKMQIQSDIEIISLIESKLVYLEIDEDKFLQVINNLISNAMKFTPQGGTVSVSLQEKEEEIVISVIDTGIGIPEKYHDKLFDKFTEARRRGLNGEPSTGLGMSIIKTIVEWHKGEISFQSKENEGTAFYIKLPKK